VAELLLLRCFDRRLLRRFEADVLRFSGSSSLSPFSDAVSLWLLLSLLLFLSLTSFFVTAYYYYD
jgi:hypothetical protein